MFGYRVPAPDEAMLISGGSGASGAPFRVVVGHGAFPPPIFRKTRYLTLSLPEADRAEPWRTPPGIALNRRPVVAVKAGSRPECILTTRARSLPAPTPT